MLGKKEKFQNLALILKKTIFATFHKFLTLLGNTVHKVYAIYLTESSLKSSEYIDYAFPSQINLYLSGTWKV